MPAINTTKAKLKVEGSRFKICGGDNLEKSP